MEAPASPPPVLPDAVHVLVVGAGSAGAAAAGHLAALGLEVLLVDRRPLPRAGAHWVNGISLAQFDAAGLPRPDPADVAGGTEAMHLFAGRARLRVDDHDVAGIRMNRLVARLQRRARRAGVRLFGETRLVGLGIRPGAPVTAHLLPAGSEAPHPVEAELVVDATGLPGTARRLVPEIAAACPPVPHDAVCAAAQATFEVRDPDGAARFRRKMCVSVDEILCRVSPAGGYSVENVRVGNRRVEILTGAIPALGHGAGRHLLDRVVRRLDFLGAPRCIGQRPIPLRRPYDRLAFGRIVLLGDAGCQVFAGHGSGVGVGLIAARMLADAVVEAGTIPEEAAWRYAHRFQTGLGPVLAASSAFARFTTTLSPEDVETLFGARIFTESLVRNGLCQSPGIPPPEEWPELAAGALRHRALSLTLARQVRRMARLARHYRHHPDRPDPSAARAWSRQLAALTASPPDLS